VHMCMYVLKWLYSYRMIQSDMHLCRGAYLHVVNVSQVYIPADMHLFLRCISVCIWLYFLSVYIQICTFCPVHIWMYLIVFCLHIHAHMHSWSRAYLPVCDCKFLLNTYTYIKMGGCFYCAKSAALRHTGITEVVQGLLPLQEHWQEVVNRPRASWCGQSRTSLLVLLHGGSCQQGQQPQLQLHNRLLAKNDSNQTTRSTICEEKKSGLKTAPRRKLRAKIH